MVVILTRLLIREGGNISCKTLLLRFLVASRRDQTHPPRMSSQAPCIPDTAPDEVIISIISLSLSLSLSLLLHSFTPIRNARRVESDETNFPEAQA